MHLGRVEVDVQRLELHLQSELELLDLSFFVFGDDAFKIVGFLRLKRDLREQLVERSLTCGHLGLFLELGSFAPFEAFDHLLVELSCEVDPLLDVEGEDEGLAEVLGLEGAVTDIRLEQITHELKEQTAVQLHWHDLVVVEFLFELEGRVRAVFGPLLELLAEHFLEIDCFEVPVGLVHKTNSLVQLARGQELFHSVRLRNDLPEEFHFSPIELLSYGCFCGGGLDVGAWVHVG